MRLSRRQLGALLLTLGVMLLSGGGGVAWFLGYRVPQPVEVEIPVGWSSRRIATELATQRVIPLAWPFLVLDRLSDGAIRAGEYRFEPGATPAQVLDKLQRGAVIMRRFGFPEGWRVSEIARHLAQAGWPEAPELLREPGLPARLGLDSPHLEGWLFPDTYFYRRGETTLELVERMVVQARKALAAEWAARPAHHPLTPYQTLILASIVEKETGKAEERPLIAGVFHNRLRIKMKLDSDPTVIYGIPDFNGNLTRKDLRTTTPYNTYKIAGLPPTPICNPGRDSLHAAFHPAPTEALYFVADGTGGHVFSATLEEHNRNVRRYQLN